MTSPDRLIYFKGSCFTATLHSDTGVTEHAVLAGGRIFWGECDLSCDWWCCVYSDAHDIHYRLCCVLLLPEQVPLACDLHLHRLFLKPHWAGARMEEIAQGD